MWEDLFAYARRNDPGTSKDAADSMAKTLPHLMELVYRAIVASRHRGRNLDELIEDTGIEKVTLSPRLRPLADRGLIVEKEPKRPGKSGRDQTVWVAKEFAQ